MTNTAKPRADELCYTVSHKSETPFVSSTKDARSIKSGRALQEALLTLLELKPFDQITIRDIVAEAGVHYATFFRHHSTKEALLDHVAADQIDRLVELTLPVLDSVDSQSAFVALCSYVNDHRKLWTTLLTGGAAGTMRDELLRVSRSLASDRAPEDSWLPVELAVICTVSLIVETLAWWLRQSHDGPTTEDVAHILHRLIVTSTIPFDRNVSKA